MELVRIESSNIAGAGYNDLGALFVKFKGNPGPVYRYPDAPEDIFTGLVEADSPGRFFNTQVRDGLKGFRLPEDEWADYVVPEPADDDE